MELSQYLATATVDKKKKVTVKRKDTGRVVHVSPETLKENKQDYAQVKDKPEVEVPKGEKPAKGKAKKEPDKKEPKAVTKPKPIKTDPIKFKKDPKHQAEVLKGVGDGIGEASKNLKADIKESLPPKKKGLLSRALDNLAPGKTMRAFVDLGLDVVGGWMMDKVLKPYITNNLVRGILGGALGGIAAGIVKSVGNKLLSLRKPPKEAKAAAEDKLDTFLGLMEEEMQGLAKKLSSGKLKLKTKK